MNNKHLIVASCWFFYPHYCCCSYYYYFTSYHTNTFICWAWNIFYVKCVCQYQVQCVLNDYQIFVTTEISFWIICLCCTQLADPNTSRSSTYVYVRLVFCTADRQPPSANKESLRYCFLLTRHSPATARASFKSLSAPSVLQATQPPAMITMAPLFSTTSAHFHQTSRLQILYSPPWETRSRKSHILFCRFLTVVHDIWMHRF